MDSVTRAGKKIVAISTMRWVLAVLIGMAAGVYGGVKLLPRVWGHIAVVQGSSMAPTFEPGARVFTQSPDGPINRGDIVVVIDGFNGRAIKRIIGLPGEKVQLWRGYVFIDGKLLREPYLPKYTFTHPDQALKRSSFALGSSNYFVLGDNREFSFDSRHYGPLCEGAILAVVPQSGAVPPEFVAYALPVHVHGRQNASPQKQQVAGK